MNYLKNYFEEIFKYTHDSNMKTAEALINSSLPLNDVTYKLFNHILNAHCIWNNRIVKLQELPDVWEMHTNEEGAILNDSNFNHSLKIIKELNPDNRVCYFNSKGQQFSNTVGDILFHVVNHSTYHRGQIITAIKQSGTNVPVTDYIFYKR